MVADNNGDGSRSAILLTLRHMGQLDRCEGERGINEKRLGVGDVGNLCCTTDGQGRAGKSKGAGGCVRHRCVVHPSSPLPHIISLQTAGLAAPTTADSVQMFVTGQKRHDGEKQIRLTRISTTRDWSLVAEEGMYEDVMP